MGIYEELVARGLIAQVTDEDRIKDLVNNGKATFYIGFDPTADSLHVGHFMALCLMKRLQMAGNKPIALIGGGTGMVGDPSGRTDMRKMMTPEIIQHNCDCFKKHAFRDPNGIRPLCFGTQKQADGTTDYLVSSESVTMVGLEYDFVRDLAPGEAIFISKDREFFSCQCAENPQLNPCAFEYVYFARPDSYIDGISVYGARLRLGEYLANEVAEHLNLRDIDVVMPIPDSSRPCAQQLAEKLKLTYREGFIKNRYVGRTFIMPGQEMRKKSVRQKLNAMPVEFADKNILLVDDSIVRGTTMREIVRMARESGAKKVYVASSAPRVMYPNVYGIDMPTRSELICGHGATAEEVARQIGADAVIFQTVEGLKGALKDLNPNITRFDCSCFDGEYVTGDIDATYLDNLEASRSKPVKPAKDDEE